MTNSVADLFARYRREGKGILIDTKYLDGNKLICKAHDLNGFLNRSIAMLWG